MTRKLATAAAARPAHRVRFDILLMSMTPPSWMCLSVGISTTSGGQPGSCFVPDFIARDPLTGRVIAVESKMGSGAHFTPGHLDGYEKLAQGQPLEARSAAMQRELDRYRITGVRRAGIPLEH
jgi:hypothetical protein